MSLGNHETELPGGFLIAGHVQDAVHDPLAPRDSLQLRLQAERRASSRQRSQLLDLRSPIHRPERSGCRGPRGSAHPRR